MTEAMKDRDELDVREAMDAALIRAAFAQIQRREIEAIEAELGSDTQLAREADAFVTRTPPKTLRLIASQVSAQHRRRAIHGTLPRIAQYAAAVMLICLIGGATAVATVPNVRQQIIKLMIRMEETHVDIRLGRNDELSIDVPEEWEGRYFPSIIPEGYTLLEVSNIFDDHDIIYLNDEGHVFNFSEYSDGAGISLDTENAKVTHMEINGWQTMLVEKNGETNAVWSEFDRILMLRQFGDIDQAIRTIKSITRIN